MWSSRRFGTLNKENNLQNVYDIDKKMQSAKINEEMETQAAINSISSSSNVENLSTESLLNAMNEVIGDEKKEFVASKSESNENIKTTDSQVSQEKDGNKSVLAESFLSASQPEKIIVTSEGQILRRSERKKDERMEPGEIPDSENDI